MLNKDGICCTRARDGKTVLRPTECTFCAQYEERHHYSVFVTTNSVYPFFKSFFISFFIEIVQHSPASVFDFSTFHVLSVTLSLWHHNYTAWHHLCISLPIWVKLKTERQEIDEQHKNKIRMHFCMFFVRESSFARKTCFLESCSAKLVFQLFLHILCFQIHSLNLNNYA